MVAVRLPCVFGASIDVLADAVRAHQPQLVLCVGQAGGRSEVSLERIAINVDDPIEDGQDFLLDVELDYLTPADTANEVLEAYGVQGMPTSYLVDPEGIVRKVHTGFREGDIEILEEEIRKLLAESAD